MEESLAHLAKTSTLSAVAPVLVVHAQAQLSTALSRADSQASAAEHNDHPPGGNLTEQVRHCLAHHARNLHPIRTCTL